MRPVDPLRRVMTERTRPSSVPTRDLVVPCDGEGHRVRLARGLRFFASARCPRCRAPVDPLRWRRLTGWLASLLRPLRQGWVDRAFHVGAWGWVAAVAAATLLLWGFADVWWPATILLFGPRWVLLLPAVVLIPWAALRDRELLLLLGAATWLGLGPLTGVETGWRGLLPGGDGPTLRVATLNAAGGRGLPSVDRLLGEWNADVVVFQECGSPLRDQVLAQGTAGSPLSVHADDGLCLVSRLELVDTREMDRGAFEFAGGSGLVRGYRLLWGPDTVSVTNVHLETQRVGLDLFRQGRIFAAIPRLREKSFLRGVEHRAARRFADALGGPGIVAGDFNTPPESRSYRTEWEGWTNAFTVRGRGVGGTRLNGWIRARIDHVLADDGWRVVSVEVGEDVGSDHLPVVATLRLR